MYILDIYIFIIKNIFPDLSLLLCVTTTFTIYNLQSRPRLAAFCGTTTFTIYNLVLPFMLFVSPLLLQFTAFFPTLVVCGVTPCAICIFRHRAASARAFLRVANRSFF